MELEINSCSNLDCSNTITEHRDASKLTESEKRYGALCNWCKMRMEMHIQFAIECKNCGTLVGIKYFSVPPKHFKYLYYCKSCRACGGTKEDETNIVTKKRFFIKLLNNFKQWLKKKQLNKRKKKPS